MAWESNRVCFGEIKDEIRSIGWPLPAFFEAIQ